MRSLAGGPRALREHAERIGVHHEADDPAKVRVGLGLGGALRADQLWAVADASEEVGLDSLWFAERLSGDQLAPMAAMAAVAARTRRLRFGSSALILPGRDPVRLAKELATIDELSRGRLIPVFGLVAPGSGDRELLRVPTGAAGRWADEALTVMRRLWAGETIDHHGEFFSYTGLRVGPRSAGSPPLDVWTGGHSAAAISRAGRLADGWLPSFVPPDRYHGLAQQVIEAAGAAGRPWDIGHFGMVVPYVPRGSEDASEPVLRALSLRVRGAATEDVVVTDATGLLPHLRRYVEGGASKFVALPVAAPRDWSAEVSWLQDTVAGPLRELTLPG
jgi:probable F420-dependent oxidoreductase